MTPTTSTRARSSPANIDRDELATFLDTLATTLAQESSHNAGTTGDGTIAVVRGERLEGGEVRYATINATPMKDRRLMFGSAVFAVPFGASLFFIKLVYGWLLNEDGYEALAAETSASPDSAESGRPCVQGPGIPPGAGRAVCCAAREGGAPAPGP